MNTHRALSALSDTAMVLAAGFGTRMRPLTLDAPKPLLKVGGRTMLDHALDHLKKAGVARAVVNSHYLADKIEGHLATRSDLELISSPEVEILDTGGGIKKALSHFGGKPFFCLNADLPWVDGAEPALRRMADFWDPQRMDVLLLLYPTAGAKGFPPKGDFMCEPDGRLWRKGAPESRPFVFISALLVKPELYEDVAQTAFSNNIIFDKAEENGRLFGIVHDGSCYHVGTPQDLAEANRLLDTGEGWG